MTRKEFELFFKTTYPSVTFFCRKYLRNEILVEDIVQDSFLKIYQNRKKLNSDSEARSYLYRTIKNMCLDKIKHDDVHDRFATTILQNNTFETDALEEISKQEVLQHIHTAISQLPHKTQMVVKLSMEGNSNQEIADKMDVSVNTIKTQKKDAYKKLRSSINKQIISDSGLLYINLILL